MSIDSRPDISKPEMYLRLCIPHVVTFLLVMLNLIATNVPMMQSMKPDFVLIAVYYWAVYRPALIPPAVVFVIGIFMDLLSGTYTGLYALTYISVQWLVRNQRRFLMGQPFFTLWLGFAAVCSVVEFLQWSVYALTQDVPPEIAPVLIQLGASVFMFPFIVLALFLVHRGLPEVPQRRL